MTVVLFLLSVTSSRGKATSDAVLTRSHEIAVRRLCDVIEYLISDGVEEGDIVIVHQGLSRPGRAVIVVVGDGDFVVDEEAQCV